VLGWARPDPPVSILALVGLAFCSSSRAWKSTGLAQSPLFVAIVLVATSLGVIFPVLKDSGAIDSDLGRLVIAAASIADVSAERSRRLSGVLRRLQGTTAEIRVRAAFLLLIGFTALAQSVDLETILGASAAGALLALLDRDKATTHPRFRLKLEAVGFGVFIPVFFVTSGLTFDLGALLASASAIAQVPLFLLAILLARGLPALAYARVLGLSRSLIAGILQATSLPFIIAATQIGL
jgi:Kef-type K+ transport system membrane component KefB